MARFAPLAALAGAGLLGGCAQSPMQQHAKEFFSESIYGRASPRVVADGEEIPKGGGQYLVGKPYTIAGKTYVPSEKKYVATGLASWYGDAFHGRRTANGEIYDKNAITAAHPTMPLPSYARVTNLRNHHSIIVRVNDRGPYHANRVMDLSARAAEALNYKHIGTARIKVEYVGKAAISGSDDTKLLATLRVDGQPAQIDDFALSPTRIAEQPEVPRANPREDGDGERRASQRETFAQREIIAQRETLVRQEILTQPEVMSADQVAKLLRPSSELNVAHAPATPPVRPQRLASVEDLGPPAPPMRTNPPLPPQRPFDLGTVPGADAPIGVLRR